MGIAVGIEPYSIVGYDYSDTYKLIDVNNADTLVNSYNGQGGINQIIVGLGFRPWKPFSFGCNLKALFGDITTQSNADFSKSKYKNFYHTTLQSNTIDVHDFAITFGAQYEIETGEDKSLVLGATFEPKNKLNADATKTIITTGIDTVTKEYDSAFELPLVLGFGASYRFKNKWTFGVDYKIQKWSDAEYFGEKVFEDRKQLNLGAELRPNNMSKRYFNRIAYRWGFSTANTYYKVHGDTNRENLITAGFGFPLKRITAGTAIRESMEILSHLEGVKVAATFIMVDRKEKGQTEKGAMQEIEEQFGFPVYSIVDVYDIIEYLEENPENEENVTRIKNYLAVNGAK